MRRLFKTVIHSFEAAFTKFFENQTNSTVLLFTQFTAKRKLDQILASTDNCFAENSNSFGVHISFRQSVRDKRRRTSKAQVGVTECYASVAAAAGPGALEAAPGLPLEHSLRRRE